MLWDKIAFSVTGKVQELLLHQKTLDLQKAIGICHAHKLTSKQTKEMAGAHSDEVTSNGHRSVGETERSGQPYYTDERKIPDRSGRPDFIQDCNFHGRSHECNKTSCPEWRRVCRKCSGCNHFQSKCKKVHAVSAQAVDKGEDMDLKFLSVVSSHSVGNVMALMCINEYMFVWWWWTLC